MERLTWEYKDGGMFVDGNEVKNYICDDVAVCTGNAIIKLSKYEDMQKKIEAKIKQLELATKTEFGEHAKMKLQWVLRLLN